jgi:hypothetical protein
MYWIKYKIWKDPRGDLEKISKGVLGSSELSELVRGENRPKHVAST